MQLLGSPACVGAGGVGLAAEVEEAADLVTLLVVLVTTGTPDAVPTQYASSTQKPVEQSAETAGFHARNCATVMPYAVAGVVHESPAFATYH